MKLSIEHVGKRYRGNVWGLRDFNLELGPGILGLLGPNGAGKSTLMRIPLAYMLVAIALLLLALVGRQRQLRV
jgi:ABC-type multidrug transport system ATPase subunit